MAKSEKPIVGVVTGSESDWGIMADAAHVLDEFGVLYEPGIKSAHRTPDRMRDYATSSYRRGIRTIIAGAGGSAHLPGMIQAYEPRIPVIGVPIVSTTPNSLRRGNALASIIDMPYPITVLTVDENDAKGAALAAVRILAAGNPDLAEAVAEHTAELARKVAEDDDKLAAEGLVSFLALKRQEQERRQFG